MVDVMLPVPRLAVCLAVYNGVEWLPDQVESILAQRGVSVSIFSSVDSSIDGSEQWMDDFSVADDRVKVLPHGKKFGGAALNFFRILLEVDFSSFDYVSFSDQDDIWLPDKLLRAHETMLKTGADAYSSNVMAFWPDGRQVLIEKSQQQVRWDFLFEAAGPGCTYVMRKDLACALQALLKSRWVEMQQVGLHDWFAYAFARTHGYHWVIDEYAGMRYRQHAQNQIGVNQGWKAWRHRANKVLNGWGLAQSALIADLVGLGNDAFVQRWSGGGRVGMLWLACQAWQCRRRLRDKVLFALSCLALFIAGKRPS